MTTTTGDFRSRAGRNGGFSLVELIVATALSMIVLAAVFSALLFVARSALGAVDYTGMDLEARQGLEFFARDVRMAENVSNFSSSSVRLRVPTPTSSYEVDYTYVPSQKTFFRAYGTSSQKALIRGVDSFQLSRYTLLQTPATNDLETKQIQLELRAVKSAPSRASTSNHVISARYILRNKVVSN